MASIVLARTARPKKLELSLCWHDLHQACLSESSLPVPRWSDKLSAFESVALCEVERIQESGSVLKTPPNKLTFVNNYTPTASAVVCEWCYLTG